MNIKKICITAIALCVPLIPMLASMVTSIPGVDVGTQLSGNRFVAADWKLSASVTLDNAGITVTSEKGNPQVYYIPEFSGDILVQARLKDINQNHVVRLLVNKDVAIVFSNQFRNMSLVKVEDGKTFLSPALVTIPYTDGHIPANDPTDFVLTLSLRGEMVTVWIDSQQVSNLKVAGLAAPYKFTFTSGWMSNWTLADFAVYSLKQPN